MKKQPRILFYVQYLLGIGHVRRSSLIIQALCKQGADVDVIFGGVHIPSMSFANAKIHQLTAIKSADAQFSGLIKADGTEFTEADKQSRAQHLLDICEEINPDLIVTETYPFGRRQMRFELRPLLKWVKNQNNPPILVASIRDILQKRSAVREQECIEVVKEYYQHILVHGDPTFFPLANSFTPATDIMDKIAYSGYVCPTLDEPANTNERSNVDNPEIIVSIGGGSVGKDILQNALALQQSGYLAEHPWLLVTGPNMAAADKQYFKEQQTDKVRVVDLADNFLQRLKNAHVSVSMAGYNTVMDILLTKVPSVVIPFEGSGETEQMTRSEILAKHHILASVKHSDMTPESLKNAIESALLNKQQTLTINNNGAQNSAKLLIQWAQSHKE